MSGMWECVCGFKNKPTNQVCGGTGPLGCKAARPGANQMAFLGMAPGLTSASQEWSCSCGFRNKGMNQKCGGTGPMGCKRPRPGLGGLGGMPAQEGFGPVRRAKVGAAGANPYAQAVQENPPLAMLSMLTAAATGMDPAWAAFQGLAPPAGVMPGMPMGRQPMTWSCICGFSNKPSNEVCGGATGRLGCKLPKEWQCGSCSFKNRIANEVCGGATGKLGCKAARPPTELLVLQGALGLTSDPQKLNQPQPGQPVLPSSGWVCAACNFKNSSANMICGGKGPLGCKLPRPNDWQCAFCNFSNKQSNEVCGGLGPLGCKLPRLAS